MAENNNFTTINKQVNKIWDDAAYGVVKEVSSSISKAEASMSKSQKEAAQVQRDVSARFFQDTEAALVQTQKGSIRNPSLAELGNELIWGIYHSSATVENAKDRTERRDASIQTGSLEKSLQELYKVIELGKENDPLFLLEYFGRDGMKFPGQPGGMALVGGETPTWCKTMVIRSGLDGGNSEEKYYIGKDGEVRLRYSGSILNGEIVDKPALQWLAYDPGLILDLKGDNIKMLQSPSTLDSAGEPIGILDKSLQYNDPFLLLDKAYQEISDDGKTQTEFIPANMSMIIQSIKPKLRAKASSLLSDYTLANNVWRNVFNMEEDLKFTVAPNGNNVNEEQQVEFQKLMLESVKPLLPVVALGATTDVIKKEVQPEMVEQEALTADQFN
jgi:hypothetical protein